jgi:hypothetical protein
LSHDLHRIVIEAGIQIDLSKEQKEKAPSSIRRSVDPDSNVTVERNSHQLKQDLGRMSTDAGMTIDSSDEQYEKASSSIR